MNREQNAILVAAFKNALGPILEEFAVQLVQRVYIIVKEIHGEERALDVADHLLEAFTVILTTSQFM